jgi:ribosome-associated protein
MEEPSKARAKRDAADLKDLGDALVALPASEFEALALPEKLRDAIELARRISAHGARDRQRQYIGKLLRSTDVAAIRATIAGRELERRIAAQGFHRIEAWRGRLLAEGEPAIAALLESAPALDAAELKKLLATARADLSAGRGVAASRALFRWLRDALAAANPSG